MRCACLIIAYGGADVLARSARILKSAGFDIFIHIDAKADREDFVARLGGISQECRFLPQRIDVFWGGYSMMDAEFALLRAAVAAGSYDKYVLLSDDTFPVFPAPTLAHRLSPPRDQVTFAKVAQHSPFYERYYNFYCYDHSTTAARGEETRVPIVDSGLEDKIMEIATLRRMRKKPIDVYYGSQWWALTHATATSILEQLDHDPHLVSSFKYSSLPDELMVQSILGNRRGADQHSGPVYADFSHAKRGPRVFSSLEELPLDLQKDHLFIRKIASSSPHLIESMARRLEDGLTIYGTRPEDEENRARTLSDGSGNEILVFRLCAPESTSDHAWHGLENFGGRRFRWTALNEIEWTFAQPLAPGCVRFVITVVIQGRRTEFHENLRISFAGQSKMMHWQEGTFVAEFEHDSVDQVRVLLETPELASPFELNGTPDTRKLGLSIAL